MPPPTLPGVVPAKASESLAPAKYERLVDRLVQAQRVLGAERLAQEFGWSAAYRSPARPSPRRGPSSIADSDSDP